ncbi:MAG: zinc-ribbon and FHA domain-containing protein [Sulfolobus sp.]|nr:zinc-ribbon and FHA domain-containing protein [Sulfolobus sp.]
MPWKCPVCGYENPDDAEFCLKCGTSRQSVTQIQQASVNPPQGAVGQAETQAAQQQQVTAQEAPQPQSVSAPPVPQSVQTPSNPQAVEVQQGSQAAKGKYYLQFIQTPVHQLNNLKVPLDFETFTNISVGRSPENVIVIPDPEVSRRHAVLSLENGELYIEDLNSTNGTYVYDGKLFQPVKGRQKLNLPAVVKLGNQTVVKLSRE